MAIYFGCKASAIVMCRLTQNLFTHNFLHQPNEDAEKESCELAKAILNTFAKSRQLGEYVQSFIQALKGYGEDKTEYFLQKPMFSRVFLNE